MAAFVTDKTPWNGGRISDTVQCIRANNPSPMTYFGTNTWILTKGTCSELAASEKNVLFWPDASGAQSNVIDGNNATESANATIKNVATENGIAENAVNEGYPCIVVDPAPAGEHSTAIIETCRKQNLTIAAVVLTHHHADHTEGAQELHQATGAPIYTRDVNAIAGSLPLPAGVFCPFAGAPHMVIVDLPGHSPDSVGIMLPDEHLLLTGDVVFRHGPTVVYYPEGHLASYLATLDKLDELVETEHIACFLPGHGYPLDNPTESIAATRQHRLDRLEQIRSALASGASPDAEDIYRVVYGDTDPRLKDAAIRSIKAQLEYLGRLQQP